MLAASEQGWADPARLTGPGRRSAVLLNAARDAVAGVLAVRPDEVSFVPSTSHALQLAVLGTLAGRSRVGQRLVHSAVEHSAVFKAADWHRERGGTVDEVAVERTGRVDVAAFVRAANQPGVAAAVLQAANHEVGTRQPIAEVLEQISSTGVPLIVDAGHALLYNDPASLVAGVPVFTADARLWGGPAGVGILVVRHGNRWRPPFPLDESEHGRSLGVPNVPAIVGAAASLRAFSAAYADGSGVAGSGGVASSGGSAESQRLRRLVDRIRDQVPRTVPDSVVLGDPEDRLAHLVTFSCLYLDGEALLTALDRHDFAVSSGSSCTSDTLTPSHVLVAMGALTSGNVRVSLHPGVSEADVDRFLSVLPGVIDEVRGQIPGGPPRESPATVDLPITVVADSPLAERIVDSRGRRCPLPVLDLARAIGTVPVGAEITVLADDPAAAGDIAAWCRMRGQELVSTAEGVAEGRPANYAAYTVRRVR
jgi:cysteine desulfurase